MKLETFFEKFHLLLDTPNSIAKARELILDLAVRGKLVPQESADETAAALLVRVGSTAKTRGRPATQSAEIEPPFELPECWAWVRLPEVLVKLTDGTHRSPPNSAVGEFMYVTAKNIKSAGVSLDEITFVTKEVHDEIYARCDPSHGDVLYIKDGATTGIATINQLTGPFSMLSSVALLKPSGAIFNRYLLWAMRSPFFYAETRGSMKGAAITRVTLSVMAQSLLPLPPLAEQHRIVAKVDELMALCDRLEAQQQERRTRHAALTRASLARFADAPTPANLSLLFHGAYHIEADEVRKVIRALAVQGKLVTQDANDESGAELLRKISKEQERLVGARQIRRLDVAPLAEVDEPFLIPSSWAWTRLGLIGDWGSGSTPPRGNNELYGGGVTWLKSGELSDCRALVGSEETVTALAVKTCSFRMNRPGDVLLAMYGATIGKAAILAGPAVTNQAVCGCTPFTGVLNSYLFEFLLSQRDAFHAASEGGAQPNISKAKIVGYPFPLPPLAEQRRIVARVEQLMSLADKLDRQVSAARVASIKLLEAVVGELATPV